MIYELTMFFNELDMLELKLQEHDAFVDQFIIVEANTDHSQNPKPYHLQQAWNRFEPWHHKIKYIQFDSKGLEAGWPTENAQRRELSNHCAPQPQDHVLICDLDEFVLPGMWHHIQEQKPEKIKCMSQFMVCFANIVTEDEKGGPVIIKGKYFTDAQDNYRDISIPAVPSSSVHLSWFGTPEDFMQKIKGTPEDRGNKQLKQNPHKALELKQQGKLFSHVKKLHNNLVHLPLMNNTLITESMRHYILKHQEWLIVNPKI